MSGDSENGKIVFADRETIAMAEQQILGCTVCSDAAVIPFAWVLDRITGRGRLGSETHYALEVPAMCLRCGAMILEDALVQFDPTRE